MVNTRKVAAATVAVGSLILVTACGSSSSGGTPSTNTSASTSSSPAQASVKVPAVPQVGPAQSFPVDFSKMKALASLASSGKGKIGVILPDTKSSPRYVGQDAPYLAEAMEKAGLKSGSDFTVQNAQGSTQQQTSDAQSDIENGASVLILDGLDSGTAAGIEANAKRQGVPVIDYDRVSLKGHESYYVSFNNYQVGVLQGQGLLNCLTTEHVSSPAVYELDGSPTDNNATQFADGYNSVLAPKYNDGSLTKVGEKAVPDWDPAKAQTIFQQAFTAHSNINAVLTANDTMNQSVVTVLKGQHAPANKVPTTGQDAGSTGLQNILSGYQCMTVYKPIYEEAQAAVELALYLRANKKPPAGLINGKTDIGTSKQVPSILLQPLTVTTANMASTVAKDPDGFSYKDTCTSAYKADCTKYGITS